MSYQEVVTGNDADFAWAHLAQGAAALAGRRGERAAPIAAGAWRTRAIAAFRQAEPDSAALRAEMAARLRSLTGSTIAPERIHADAATGTAAAVVDGAVFRLVGQDLVLLRPCAHCGVGQFASPTIRDLADLGSALVVWKPLHDDCRPEDPAE